MEVVEIRRYVAIVLKRWWLILLTIVLGGGVAYYSSITTIPVYQATTTIEISPGADPRYDLFAGVRSAEMVAGTYVAQIQSPIVLREAADRLAALYPGAGLEEVSVQQVRDTQLIRISAENTDPTLAQAQADVVAEVFIERELSKQRGRFQTGLDELDQQIAKVETSIAETQRAIVLLRESPDLDEVERLELARLETELSSNYTRLSTLLRSAEDFRLAIARYTDYVSVFAPAQAPVAPIRPRTMQNTAQGLLIGLLIGIGTVFLLEYLDDTIKSPDDVKRSLPVGVLGVLPRLQDKNGRAGLVVAEQPRKPISEAFRNLRTSIRFFSLDQPAKTILVTSPLPSDGKTFIAANLAIAIAQGGQSVVLVDADMRRPMQHKMFGLPNGFGLTVALLNPNEPRAVFQQTGIEGLEVVTSGAKAPNPAELLASQRMQQFIAQQRERVDFVIIDSPPVLAFADAAVLSNLADGTILILEYGETRRTAAVQAIERLTEVGGRVLGVVLNRVAPRADGYYYYDYYYSYYSKNDRDAKDGRRGGPLTRLVTSVLNGDKARRRR